ncbi:MAG: 3-hydroxyacyl-[acyl-carrier-protein] dehydratase FabZ, partial [Pseudomonadota bacterium]
GVRFRKPVVPGDQLKLRVQKQRNRGAVWRFEGKAYVNEALVTEATFAAMIAST